MSVPLTKPSALGIGMMLAGCALLIAAVTIGWRGYERISGISTLRAATCAIASSTDQEHIHHLTQAACAALPHEAAAVLPGLDFNDPGSDAALEHLGQVCRPQDRALVDVAR